MPELDRLVRRLRSLGARDWRSGGPVAAVRRLAADLVAIGDEQHRLPELPDHALPDVIAVVGAEAYLVDPAATDRVVAAAWEQLS